MKYAVGIQIARIPGVLWVTPEGLSDTFDNVYWFDDEYDADEFAQDLVHEIRFSKERPSFIPSNLWALPPEEPPMLSPQDVWDHYWTQRDQWRRNQPEVTWQFIARADEKDIDPEWIRYHRPVDNPNVKPGGWDMEFNFVRSRQYPSQQLDEEVWVKPPRTDYGDYVGDTASRANQEALLEEFEGVFCVMAGAHGYKGIICRLEDIDEEILEAFNYIRDNAIYNDDLLHEVERVREEEAWYDWACHDFPKEVGKHLRSLYGDGWDTLKGADDLCDDLEEFDPSILLEWFQGIAVESSIYWIDDGPNRWIDVKKVAQQVTLDELKEMVPIFREEEVYLGELRQVALECGQEYVSLETLGALQACARQRSIFKRWIHDLGVDQIKITRENEKAARKRGLDVDWYYATIGVGQQELEEIFQDESTEV